MAETKSLASSLLSCDRQVTATSLIPIGSWEKDKQREDSKVLNIANARKEQGAAPDEPPSQDQRLQHPSMDEEEDDFLVHLVEKLEAGGAEKEDDLPHQHEQTDHQQWNKTEQLNSTSMWDLSTGRSGALPGLEQALGSGPKAQVERIDDVVVAETDSTFLPMNLNLEELEWLVEQERTQTDPPGPSLPPQSAAAPTEDSPE